MTIYDRQFHWGGGLLKSNGDAHKVYVYVIVGVCLTVRSTFRTGT
jgi:hypothetical protein